MKYVQPYGVSDANASYINGNPALGIEGSAVPAGAIEYSQREIVNAIHAAGLTPSNDDLSQLSKAIQTMIANAPPGYSLPSATASVLGGVKVNKGGLQVNSGLISLLLNADSGMDLDTLGRLTFNSAKMDLTAVQELLNKLRLPQWLTATKAFHVRPDGSDSNDGSADNAQGAFKTISKALNYVSENFNLSNYYAIINVRSGVYDENIVLPKYNASTGGIFLRGENVSSTLIRGAVTNARAAGTYQIENLTFQNVAGASSPTSVNWYAIYLSSGVYAILNNVKIDLSKNPPEGRGSTGVYLDGGELRFSAGCSIDCAENANTAYALRGENGGVFSLISDLSINGKVSATIRLNNGSKFSINYTTPAPKPLVLGTVTGKRYSIDGYSTCDTQGGGPGYFPGTTDGTVSDALYK